MNLYRTSRLTNAIKDIYYIYEYIYFNKITFLWIKLSFCYMFDCWHYKRNCQSNAWCQSKKYFFVAS